MADRFVFLRFMVKKVAESVGAIATFMPKPFADDFRSGAHFNMSLADTRTRHERFRARAQARASSRAATASAARTSRCTSSPGSKHTPPRSPP